MRFQRNFNNKLNCEYFTTIRPYQKDKYQINQKVPIILDDKELFKAKIIDIVEVPSLLHIDEFTLLTDSAMEFEEFQNMMKDSYPTHEGSWSIITLKNLSYEEKL